MSVSASLKIKDCARVLAPVELQQKLQQKQLQLLLLQLLVQLAPVEGAMVLAQVCVLVSVSHKIKDYFVNCNSAPKKWTGLTLATSV